MPTEYKLLTLLMMACIVVSPNAHAATYGALPSRAERQQQELRRETQQEQWLMTYYVGYQNGYLKPDDIDYSLMTHVVVGGVGVNTDGTLDEHWHLNPKDGRDMAREVGRRAERAGVKKLVWLGGPNEEDKFYAASSDAIRATFVKNIITLVDGLAYDGVDINWEPIREKDEARLLALVRDLRRADPDLIITVPVNWVPSTILARKDLSLYPKLAQHADRLFVMSYSMAGAWPGWESWHGGALAGDSVTTPSSITTSIFAYTKAGVPEEKLGIGIGTYATCWEYPVRKPDKKLPNGFSSKQIGTMSMRTLLDDYYSRRYEKWDRDAHVPYQTYTRARGDWDCGFISYENERSIEDKMEYVLDEGLGGAMVWNIGTGYLPDERRRDRHLYLTAAWEALFE